MSTIGNGQAAGHSLSCPVLTAASGSPCTCGGNQPVDVRSYSQPQPSPERMFPMQRGPAIPWSLAEVIYEAYAALYGRGQDIEKMAARGGFSWKEVEVIFAELKGREPKVWTRLMANHPMKWWA